MQDKYEEDSQEEQSKFEDEWEELGTPVSEAMERGMQEELLRMEHESEDEHAEDEDEDEYEEYEEDFFSDISNSLSMQVSDELGDEEEEAPIDEKKKMSVKMKVLTTIGIIFGVIVLSAAFLLFTKPGNRVLYRIAAKFVHNSFGEYNEDEGELNSYLTPTEVPLPTGIEVTVAPVIKHGQPRKEDYVLNCLLIGIEEMDGARNTDAMMVASINTKTNKIVLTSLLRDTYVDIPGYRGNKLNSVYAKCASREDGAKLLVETVEKNFHIKIDAYASVNFDSMAQIVDRLGGVTIELTATEANYLRTTNYIADPSNRTVVTGINRMNGGQVVGYCRVRHVPTIGGANNDYGRTLRQRRVLNAIFDEYKSQSITQLLPIAFDCLNLVRTDITEDQIVMALEMVFDNKISEIESGRVPLEGMYYDSGRQGHMGITYALVMDQEATTKTLYQTIYGDTEEEAEVNYELYKEIVGDEGEDSDVESNPSTNFNLGFAQ